MSWLHSNTWQVRLSTHQAEAWRASGGETQEEHIVASGAFALNSWEALCARLPTGAKLHVALSGDLTTSYLIQGAANMRERDWQMVARAHTKTLGLEAERYTFALDRAWLLGSRLVVAIETTLLQALQATRDTDTSQKRQHDIHVTRITGYATGLISQAIKETDSTGQHIFLAHEEESWTLAGFQDHACCFWLSYPGDVPFEGLLKESARAALAHGFEKTSPTMVGSTDPEKEKTEPKIPYGISCNKNGLWIEFVSQPRLLSKILLGCILISSFISIGYWMYAQDELTLTRKENARLQHILDESNRPKLSKTTPVKVVLPEAFKTNWPALFAQLEALSTSQDARVSSFTANGLHRTVTVELRHANAEEKLPAFVTQAVEQGWKVVSIRPQRNSGSDEPTEVVLETEEEPPQ